MTSRIAGPREIPRAFVSYARDDATFVKPIAEVMRACGVNTFVDEDSIPLGIRWRLAISESIEDCDIFLLFWSTRSEASRYVTQECRRAMDLDKRLIPALMDDTSLPNDLAEYQAIDFRGVAKWHAAQTHFSELSGTARAPSKGIYASQALAISLMVSTHEVLRTIEDEHSVERIRRVSVEWQEGWRIYRRLQKLSTTLSVIEGSDSLDRGQVNAILASYDSLMDVFRFRERDHYHSVKFDPEQLLHKYFLHRFSDAPESISVRTILETVHRTKHLLREERKRSERTDDEMKLNLRELRASVVELVERLGTYVDTYGETVVHSLRTQGQIEAPSVSEVLSNVLSALPARLERVSTVSSSNQAMQRTREDAGR